MEVKIPADEGERGGEAQVLGSASTATTTETEDTNLSTDPGCVRGRRSLCPESTAARTVRSNKTRTSHRRGPRILKTRPHGAFHGTRGQQPRSEVEKTAAAGRSFQWVPQIFVLQRPTLWLVRPRSPRPVKFSFKCAAHKIIFILSIKQHVMLMDINISAPTHPYSCLSLSYFTNNY